MNVAKMWIRKMNIVTKANSVSCKYGTFRTSGEEIVNWRPWQNEEPRNKLALYNFSLDKERKSPYNFSWQLFFMSRLQDSLDSGRWGKAIFVQITVGTFKRSQGMHSAFSNHFSKLLFNCFSGKLKEPLDLHVL